MMTHEETLKSALAKLTDMRSTSMHKEQLEVALLRIEEANKSGNVTEELIGLAYSNEIEIAKKVLHIS